LVDFDRYGTVRLDEASRIVEFREKTHVSEGLINGGVYALDKSALGGKEDKVFSLEKDFFEPEVGNQRIFGAVFDDYFIDIGIQEDYERAQREIG
jgi:D-glycero-alpha-D-manno-heptose 1-phosphate guanylyltransferase